MATRVASNNEGNGNGNKSDGQATAARTMAAATTVVGEDEGNCEGDEGGRQQRGCGWYGNGNGEKDGRGAMATASKRE